MSVIQYQMQFDNSLPVVRGNAEYQRSVEELQAMNEIIKASGIEDEVIRHWFALAQKRKNERHAKAKLHPKSLTMKEQLHIQERAVQAIRAAILRKLEKTSLRRFCKDVARAPLLQWFCQINRFGDVKVFSKSTMENYEKDIPIELIKKLETLLLKAAISGQKDQENELGLDEPVSMEECYLDTTCIKVNIHFPVDWVLLRDAVRSLMLSVTLIRRCGLNCRMPEPPEQFTRRINKLSIEMTHARRQVDSKKKRKAVLRKMKRLVKVVRNHAQRHYELLEGNWQQTKWTFKKAKQVMNRISNIITQLPEAQRQAHERIIGERQINNKDKILSLYESDIHVLLRRKAGAEVEFGNSLLLAEQANGLIIDWQLFKDKVPADANLITPTITRLNNIIGKDIINLIGTDRGFDSQKNRDYLDKITIYNAMCPRNPKGLQKRMRESRFRDAQKRRSQTEARISILKHCFSGTPMLQKGFDHREQHMGFSVLSHNLWVLARMKIAQQKEKEQLQRISA